MPVIGRPRSRLVSTVVVICWVGIAVVVVRGLATVAIEAGRTIRSAFDDRTLTAREREASPAAADGIDIDAYRFLRRQLHGKRTFYLRVSEEARRDPFTTRSGRNFALFFLYPAVAVDSPADAQAVIAIDGASLGEIGVPLTAIHRFRNVAYGEVRR